MPPATLAILLLAAGAVTWALVMVFERRCPPALRDRSAEAEGKPRIGGLALLGGLALALPFAPDSWTVLLPVGAATALGLHDDATDSSALGRLAALAGIAALAAGLAPTAVPLPVAAFGILAITVGFDFIDGLDGLAASLALVALISALVLAPTPWLAALVGAVAVYLMASNRPPARTLLGDAGSNGLGVAVALAILHLMGNAPGTATAANLAPMVLLAAVPLLDLGTTMLRRSRLDSGLFASERGHLHHRLLALHGSVGPAVLELVAVSAICAFAAVSTQTSGLGLNPLFGAALALSLLVWRTRATRPAPTDTR